MAHFSGDPQRALASFQRAAEHAERSGAVLEEATYLTSVAAAAAVLGELGTALSASTRAILLFEHLGRDGDAARAALSRASAFASAGAVHETREAAADALARPAPRATMRAALTRTSRCPTCSAGTRDASTPSERAVSLPSRAAMTSSSSQRACCATAQT